jgi:hypothetical protein
MKRLLLLLVPTVLGLYSCVSKGKEPEPVIKTYITATIDGVDETFNYVDTARFQGSTLLYISGTNETTKDKIILIFGNSGGLTAGTYASNTSPNSLQMLLGIGPGYTFDNYYYNHDSASVSTVTVAAMDSTHVNGTFSGSVVLESAANNAGTRPIKTITNGKFNLTANSNPR